jgi:integrase
LAPPKRHLERMKGVSKECKNGKDMWRAEYTLSGKRKREYFKTEGKAKRHLKSVIDNKKKGVAELQSLPVDVQIDLLNAFHRAKKNGYPLHQACAEFERSPECLPRLKFIEARENFIAAKKLKNLRPESIKKYNCGLLNFGMVFDNYYLDEISKTDFQTWLAKQQYSPKTNNDYIGNLNTLRNWCSNQNYEVGRFNPFDLEKIEIDKPEAEVMKFDKIEPYVRKALETPKVGLVVVLVLFCGVRIAEATQTSLKDMKLDRKKPIITVSSQAAKKRRRRVIELTPTAVLWIKAAIAAGCVTPETEHSFIKARKVAGLQLPANILRHTFCSYHLAHFKNKNLTAELAGNSPTVIDEFYKGLVDPEDAEQFFNLKP